MTNIVGYINFEYNPKQNVGAIPPFKAVRRFDGVEGNSAGRGMLYAKENSFSKGHPELVSGSNLLLKILAEIKTIT